MNKKGEEGGGVPWWVVGLLLALLVFAASLYIVPYIKQLLGIGTSYTSSTDFDKSQPPEPGKTKKLIKNTESILALPNFIIFNLK